MASRTLYASIIVAGAVLALAVGPQTPIGAALWPPAAEGPDPSGALLAGFVAYGIYSAVGFGVGAALVVALARRTGHLARARRHGVMSVVALGWLTMSWIPHDNLHMMVGTDPVGLLALEWGFHGTLILAATIVATYLVRTWPAPHESPRGSVPARGETA